MSDETNNEVEDAQLFDEAPETAEDPMTESTDSAESAESTESAEAADVEAAAETGAEAEVEPTVAAEEPADAEPTADAEPVADAEAAANAPAAAEPEEPVDPARQAEIDALAAELANGAAPLKKPATRRKSRRVTAKDPAELAERALEKDPQSEDAEAAPADEGAVAQEVDAAAADVASEPVEADESGDAAEAGEVAEGEQSPRSRSRRGRNRSSARAAQGEDGEAAQPAQPAQNGQAQQQNQRKRGRGRGGLGDDLEPEILEDDVLIPVAGILDVLENYAFVRTTGYLPGASDVYVSLGQVKKYGMRKGDAIVGAVRQPRDGEQSTRQKYNALVKVDSVSGLTAEQSVARPEYATLTPIRATEASGLQAAGTAVLKGQRVLVVGGHASGKTSLVASLAEQAGSGGSDSHLMVVLLGSRPEEVTEFRRSVKGEVIAAGLDEGVEDEITIVELAVERAKRLVEFGHNVVIVIDSIHQLGRAYASLAPSNRHGAEDPAVTGATKRIFGAARAIEDGATLTIVATASEDTAGDRFLVTELGSLANAVVRL